MMGNQRDVLPETSTMDQLVAQVQEPDPVMGEVSRLRDQGKMHELPTVPPEVRSAAQAGYELARNDWALLADAERVTRGKLSNYGLDQWDLQELASNMAYPFDCQQRETLQYLSNHMAEISPQGRLTAANLVDFARQKASQFDSGITAPDSFGLSSKNEQAKSIAEDLDNGKNREAAAKFRQASEFLLPGEFRNFVLSINKQEKDGEGANITLYDSSGKPTVDENAAVGFRVSTDTSKLGPKYKQSPESIDLSPESLANDLDAGNSAVAAEKLASASKAMSQKQFGDFVKQVNRIEKDAVGADVILIDDKGQETQDETKAAGFDIRLPVSTNDSQYRQQQIQPDADKLAQSMDSADIKTVTDQLAVLSKNLAPAEFKTLIAAIDAKEKDNVGVDIILLDAKGQPTKDPTAAVTFNFVRPQTAAPIR